MPPKVNVHPSIRDKGRYRIQSVETEQFVERKGAGLVLYPLKKTSENQEWVFVKKQNNAYEIESVRNDSDSFLVANNSNPSSPQFGLEQRPVQGTAFGTSWKFYSASKDNDHLYIVSAELKANKVNNYLVYVNTSDREVTFGRDPSVRFEQDFRKLDKDEEYRWRLIESTPASLPDVDTDGQYRIRTLNGMVVHSLPDRDTLSTKNQNRGDHRAWTITDLGNGNCTIFNVAKKKYLATKRVNGFWEHCLADSAPLALQSTGSTADEEKDNSPWRIEILGEYTWVIYVWRETVRSNVERLSLALKDDTVILKPWKIAHNQLWMIEATDAPVAGDAKPINDSNLVLPGSTLALNTPYQFLSNDRSGGIRVAFISGNYVASVTHNTTFTPSPLYMERNAGGKDGEVFIYRSLNATKYYLALSANMVSVGTVQYSWTIEQAQPQGSLLIRDTQSTVYLSPNIQSGTLIVKARSGPNDTTTLWAITS